MRTDCVVLLPDQRPLVIDAKFPLEAVTAFHDGFDDIVQKAYRAQVMMVSPTLLMLAIQVIQQIQKDSQMREATDLIRTEVGHMVKDVKLLSCLLYTSQSPR